MASISGLVNIIITTYGGSEKLERAINTAINQTYQNIQVIVVDDNNPDTEARERTEKIVEKFHNIIYIKHEKNKNASAARNTGIDASKGEYLAFLDDDDVFLPTRIEKLVKFIETKDIDVEGIASSVAFVNSDGINSVLSYPTGTEVSQRGMLTGESWLGTGSNIFVRRDAALSISGFDDSYNRFQDVEFTIRFLKENRIIWLDDILVIKEESDVRKPNYAKTKVAYKKLHNDFSYIIESMDEKQRYQFEKNHLMNLFWIAYQDSDDDHNKLYSLMCQKNMLKFKDIILINIKKSAFRIVPQFAIDIIQQKKNDVRILETKQMLGSTYEDLMMFLR